MNIAPKHVVNLKQYVKVPEQSKPENGVSIHNAETYQEAFRREREREWINSDKALNAPILDLYSNALFARRKNAETQ